MPWQNKEGSTMTLLRTYGTSNGFYHVNMKQQILSSLLSIVNLKSSTFITVVHHILEKISPTPKPIHLDCLESSWLWLIVIHYNLQALIVSGILPNRPFKWFTIALNTPSIEFLHFALIINSSSPNSRSSWNFWLLEAKNQSYNLSIYWYVWI